MIGLTAQAVVAHASCTNHPVLLNVAVSSDLAPAVDQVAQNFNKQERSALGRCVQVQVSPAPPGTVASAIDGQARDQAAPSVDAWIPDSSLWVDVARSFPLGARAVRPTGISVAESPLMIVTPRQVAKETRLFAAPVSWDVLLPASDGGPPASLKLRVDLPDPTANAAGLASLVQLSRLLGHSSAALTSFTRFALSSAATPQFDDPKSLALFVATAGPPLNSRPVTVTTEQAVTAYDRVNPGRPLAAQYPTGTRAGLGSPVMDYPYVLTTSDPAQAQAAREFGRALQQPYAAALVRYDGFRSADGMADAAPASFGLNRQVLQRAPTAVPSDAQTTLEAWGKLGLGSRDLVLTDVSGAMARPDGNGTQTLEQALVKTSAVGLPLFPDSTEMGEWEMADHLKGGRPYEQLISVGPLPAPLGVIDRRQAIAHIIQTLRPVGGPLKLNDSILAAYKQMLDTYKPSYSNAVIVLTSGVDNAPGDISASELEGRLRALSSASRKVEIVPVMLGTAGNFAELRKLAVMTGGVAYDVTNPAQIAKIFFEGFAHRLCDSGCNAP